MGAISRFALRNPVVIVLLLVMVAGGGIYSAFSMHQEAFPDISLPAVTVSTTYPGASASSVFNTVTGPLETALKGVPGVQALDSNSAAGISRVVAQFDVGSDTAAIQRDVQDAVNGVALPSGVARPQISLNGPNSRPIVTYSLEGADVARLTGVANTTVVPALQAINGVAAVNVLGGARRAVLVNADPLTMEAHSLSIASIDNSIAVGAASQPVGAATFGGVTQPVGAGNTPDSLAAIRRLPIVSAGAGGLGRGGIGTGGASTAQTATQQAAVYLSAARAALIAYEGKSAQNSSLDIGTGPTAPAEADIVSALADLSAHTSRAIGSARAAELWLTRLERKDPSLASNINFSNAVAWLQSANATLVLSGAGAPKLTIGDVATVSLGTPGIGAIVHSNGHGGILLQVMRSDSADTVQVANAVRHTLSTLALPQGIHAVKVVDISDTIVSSIDGAAREGLVGALLAVIIIGLFLRNWRATLIAVITIPIAFLLTLILLNALGLTLNVITLAGFAVATGRVVDDSIVVIENLYRRIAAGEPATRAGVLAGVVDVGAAITSSTATTVCVFLPLAFVAGIVSVFFASFAWTVTIALFSSYLAAITVVPLLAYALLGRGHVPAERGEGALARRYRGILSWSLDHRLAVLGLSVLTVLLALVILRRMPTNLVSQTGQASAQVNITAPAGTSLPDTGAIASRVERVIGRDSDVASYYTTIGDVNQHGLLSTSSRVVQSNQGSTFITFKNGVDGTAATNRLRSLLTSSHPGATVDVHSSDAANSGLEIDITGSNPENIRTATHQVETVVRSVGGVASVADTLSAARPEIAAQVDPAKAQNYGLTPSLVVSQLQALLNGVTAGHTTIDNTPTDIVVQLTPGTLGSASDLAALPLSTGSGLVSLGQVATVRQTSGAVLITRHNQQLASVIGGSITSSDVGGVSNKIAQKLRTLKLPGDTVATLNGVSRQQSVAFSNVYTAMLIAVVLVFIVMVLAFRTLTAPLAILAALPVTLIGAAGGLAVGRQTLGLPALIGFLMLIGIVVTNAIVLMTRVQQFRATGASTRAALLDAGVNRLRPILMTAVATIGALVPLGLGLAEGSLISQSLADAVIGGLVSSTLLTLVVVPVVYSLLVPDAPARPAAETPDAERTPVAASV